MSEAVEEEKTGKIILDKYFWIEPLSLGWALKYERETNRPSKTNPDKNVVEKDVWYPSGLLGCITSYVDKKMHLQIREADEAYTKEEVLNDIEIVLRGIEKRFGYLKNIQSISDS